MKKLSQFLALSLIVFPLANATVSAAYDYNCYYSDYLDETTYSTHKESKTGTLSNADSFLDGCDVYTVETVEAYDSLPILETKYDYVLAPSDVIGSWFEYRSEFDDCFSRSYDVKLPLHTGYVLNEETFELEDGVFYDIDVMWKTVPYISITADTKSAPLFDNAQLRQLFPDINIVSMGTDDDGNYISYMFAGGIYTDIGDYESDADTVISLEDAKKIAGLRNEHVLDMSYCTSYETQRISLCEYPTYTADTVEYAASVFEAYGYDVTIENGCQIVPAGHVPALEYFEIISEIQMKKDAMPNMLMYEPVSSGLVNSVGLLSAPQGDINGDGEIGIADMVLLQKYLLGGKSISLSADLNEDGSIDSYDMILMRKMIVNKLG
ncbi:MAG: dockerin type I repeat-containing protein [Alistipes sp.]|nr:dockerin type I repeat-containing protein [Alistipes sp.]